MTDMSEKQTIEYFTGGLKKARSAALELCAMKKNSAWPRIVTLLDQLGHGAKKFYEGKAQSRSETLSLANIVEREGEPKTTVSESKLIH